MPRSGISCREFVASIRDFRDDELSEGDRRSFLEHRQTCVRCSDYLKGFELTIGAIKMNSADWGDPGETTIPKSLVRKILDRRS